jgi:predicted lipoprotein with Yx(FWY)xxD motif
MRKELMKRTVTLAVAPIAAAVAIAGCGGGSGGSSSSAAAPKPASRGTGTELTLTQAKVGNYLSDSRGRALYVFEADKGTMSTCYSACASIWPPLTASGAVKPGAGVSAGLLGTTKRTDGTIEVTYNGHPLYYYAGDSGPGQTTGQGLNQFGAKWYLLAATGNKINGNGS